MSNSLLKKPPRPIPWGNLTALGLLGLVLAATIYFFMGFSHPENPNGQNHANGRSADPRSHDHFLSSTRTAKEFRQQMLEKDRLLLAKYDRLKREKSQANRPNRRDAYRKWEQQKSQTQNYLSRFKDQRTDDPASVKQQLIKSIGDLNGDAPLR